VERRSGKYFGAGTALRQIHCIVGHRWNANSVPANHVVLVRLTLDQFIFWPKLPPIAGFGMRKISKNFPGCQWEGATPSRTLPYRGYTLLLGPRSRKPFPQIKIYHYTPGIEISEPYIFSS